jgi:hypothetical protein
MMVFGSETRSGQPSNLAIAISLGGDSFTYCHTGSDAGLRHSKGDDSHIAATESANFTP